MMERNLMITALRKQRTLLEGLISQVETQTHKNAGETELYEKQSRKVEKNLKRLRELKKTYFQYMVQ